MSKKLDELLKKKEQLKARIQQEKNKLSQQKRKEDTRRKILLGSLMIHMMKTGELDEEKINQKLDEFLTKDIDRKLFALPLNKTSISEIKKQKEFVKDESMVEVILEEIIQNKILSVIQIVRRVTSLEVKEAREMIENAPTLVIKTNLKEAEQIKNLLNKAGAKVSIR